MSLETEQQSEELAALAAIFGEDDCEVRDAKPRLEL
jgi:hypothetical protein